MTLQDVIKRGLELGLEAVEVYACNSESNTLKLDEGKLESYNIKEIFAINRCDEGMLPDYWFSGHTHTSTYRPMTINNKEVIFASNQFGYYFETGKTGYSKNCIFEI